MVDMDQKKNITRMQFTNIAYQTIKPILTRKLEATYPMTDGYMLSDEERMAASLILELGILHPDEDGNFNSEEYITNEEFGFGSYMIKNHLNDIKENEDKFYFNLENQIAERERERWHKLIS